MYLSSMPGDGMGDFFILQCYTEIERKHSVNPVRTQS